MEDRSTSTNHSFACVSYQFSAEFHHLNLENKDFDVLGNI